MVCVVLWGQGKGFSVGGIGYDIKVATKRVVDQPVKTWCNHAGSTPCTIPGSTIARSPRAPVKTHGAHTRIEKQFRVVLVS